jgi:hypothetical protein
MQEKAERRPGNSRNTEKAPPCSSMVFIIRSDICAVLHGVRSQRSLFSAATQPAASSKESNKKSAGVFGAVVKPLPPLLTPAGESVSIKRYFAT